MDLSIIIVNWNSKDYLENCISSIIEETSGISYEIIVIDSGSFDGCENILNKKFEGVRFIQSKENLGFASANNRAFRDTIGEYVLFLNPDTIIMNNSLNLLLDKLEISPNVAIVGAKLLNTDGSLQTSCIQAFPTITNQIFDNEFLRQILPKISLWGNQPLFQATIEKSVKVDSVSGACLMIKRDIFKEVNYFSTEYFMYSEDIDLCYKCFQKGYSVYYIPDAIILHHGGKSSVNAKYNFFSDILMVESQYRYFNKFFSASYAKMYRISILIMSILRIIIIVSIFPILMISKSPHSIRQIIKKWRSRLRWTIGLVGWVKNL